MIRRTYGVRPWVVGTLALLLAGFGLVSLSRRITSTEPSLGIDWVQSSEGPLAVSVEPGSPAAEAGVSAGDLLFRANGRLIATAIEAANLPWKVGMDRPIRLEMRRGVEHLSVDAWARRRPSVPPLYAYLALVGFGFLASGTFIAIRLPLVRGGRVYALLSAAVFGATVLSHTGTADTLDWWVFWADVAAGALAPSLLLHLSLLLSRRAVSVPKLARILAYVPAAAFLLYATWLVGLAGAYRFADPVRRVEGTDRLGHLLLALSAVLAAAVLGVSLLRSNSTLHRSQMRWMLWGLAVGMFPFLSIYALSWAFGAIVPEWADLAVLPMLAVPAAFTAALARYRLHDLDLVLRRGLAAVALGFFTVGLYSAVLVVLRRLVASLLLPESVLGFLAALVTAVAYPGLRGWVRTGVDRAFYRKRYSYRATLLDWGRELSAEMHLPSLLDLLQERVCRTLGVAEALVLVRVGNESFEGLGVLRSACSVALDPEMLLSLGKEPYVVVEDPIHPSIPWVRYVFGMKVKGRLCAVLLTAEREGVDERLSSEDRGLLATLSAHAATAIEAARLFREVRRHAEQVDRLKASQERILESSGVGLLLLGGDGSILAWNRTLEAIYGLSREEAIGRKMSDVFPLYTVRRIERELAAVSSGEEARIYRHALVNRAGQPIILNLAISPESRESAGDGARVVTCDDVTERVKLEEQLLRQERLASLGLLAAGVAHEVNTPLTGISSYTQMLLEDMHEGDPRREILEKIEVQSRRASTIANSLLNLASPDRASFESVHLHETVSEVLRLFEPQIRGRGIRLEASTEADLPAVRGDKGKLQQVLLNLLLNARDAVELEGRIEVVTFERGDRVVLEVTDNGVGIAEEDLPRIFDPFFTTKGRGKGTGLGLSISYGIVREHEGELVAESVPGEFTRFRVELPAFRLARALA